MGSCFKACLKVAVDSNDLLLLVRIMRLGTISAAARDLGLSPAAASARLLAFERSPGVRLVHRTTRAASLTEDGLAFLPHAEAILEATDAAEAAIGGANAQEGLLRGVLRVAAPASFGRMHVVPHLPEFLSRHPLLTMDLRLSDTLVDLAEGAFDAAIRDAELTDSSFMARRLAPDRRLLVAAPAYLARHGVPIAPSDLRDHACLVVGGHDTWTLEDASGSLVEIGVSGPLRMDDGAAVCDAAVLGLGIALMSTWAAGENLRRGELVPVLPGYKLESRHALWAVYPSARLLAPKVRALIDFLAEQYGAGAPGPPY